MTITLHLTTEQERRLEEGTAREDRSTVRRVLLQAVETTVDELVGASARPDPSDEEFEALSHRLADHLATTAPGTHRSLSDDCLTRAAIYGEHP